MKKPVGNYAISDLLTNRDVTAFAQDGKGQMWIGTSEGLNIFSGNGFMQMIHDNKDSSSIPDDNILCLYRDKNHVMWVGTMGGLARYDGAFHFSRIAIPTTRYGVFQIGEDSKGNILANNGYDIYKIKGDVVSKGYHFKTPSNFNLFFPDHTGGYWVDNQQSINHFNNKGRIDKSLYTPNANVSYYYKEGDTLWITQSRDVRGINLRTNDVFFTNREETHILPTSLYHAKGNNLLLNSGFHGMYSIDTKSGKLTKVDTEKLKLHHKDVTISTFYRDSKGNLWIGYDGGGFQIISPSEFSYNNHAAAFTPLQETIAGNNITCLDNVGDNIIGSTEEEVFSYNPSTGSMISYPYYDIFTDSPFYRQTLVDVIDYDSHRFWLISNVRILSCLAENGKIKVSKIGFSRYHTGSSLGCGVRDGENVYVTSNTAYLIRCKFDSDRPDSIKVNDSHYDRTSCLANLGGGKILIAMKGMRFALYDSKRNTVENINTQSDSNVSFMKPSCVFRDTKNRIWIGTKRNGLYTFNLSTGKLSKDNTVPIEDIKSIEDGKDGNLWICSHEHIVVYNPSNHNFYFCPSQPDNSQTIWGARSIIKSSCYLPSRNALIVGTTNGITVYPAVREPGKKAEISVIGVFVGRGNDKVKSIDDTFSEGSHYTIPYSDNDLTVFFSSMDYGRSQQFMTQYILEGYNKDWQSVTNDNKASFADLPPGDYTFKVKLVASPLGAPLAMHTIEITVRCPIYRSFAAYYFYLILILSVVLYLNRLYLRMRTDRLRLDQINRERERDKRTNEMNMSFFANVSHEFRNPLTIIAGPLMVLRDDKSLPPAVHHTLNMICKSVNRMLRLIDQMLDFNQLETDALRLRIAHYDIASELSQIVNVFSESAKLRGVNVESIGMDSNIYGWIDKDKLEKIMSNLLTNALKHVAENGIIRIELKACESAQNTDLAKHLPDNYTGRFVSVKVYNNGNHIDEDKLPYVFNRYYQAHKEGGKHQYGWGTGLGLYYVKRQVMLHHGGVWVKNVPEGGVTFQFVLPIDEAVYRDAEHIDKEDGIMQIPIEEKSDNTEQRIEDNRKDVNMTAKKPVILIVDDDIDVAQYIHSIFSEDYVVVNCYSAESALADMDKIKPDIILSDVVMGEMDGYDRPISGLWLATSSLTQVTSSFHRELFLESSSDDPHGSSSPVVSSSPDSVRYSSTRRARKPAVSSLRAFLRM